MYVDITLLHSVRNVLKVKYLKYLDLIRLFSIIHHGMQHMLCDCGCTVMSIGKKNILLNSHFQDTVLFTSIPFTWTLTKYCF